ncbi:GTP-binding protein [Synechocystis sp. LKSZ1]|uniref:GTP-binding protein n=1 Tax=Synechocystis sp. LKSZ1 TaxID=3144951 RepID=UPI00336BD941
MTELHLNPQELEQTLQSFGAMQEELNYQQAQKSLRDLVRNLELRPQEQQGLEQDLAQLSNLLEKLEQAVVQIAAFGMVGRGKSSVLNALMGRPVFAAGPVHGVTQSPQTVHWPLSAGCQEATLAAWGNAQIQLIDTPGIDEVNGEAREAIARAVAEQTDLILFVVSGDISQVEYQALSQLREIGKPMLLVFNKIDQYPAADRQLIYETIRDQRVRELLSPEEIVMVAAHPLQTEAIQTSTGQWQRRQCRGPAQVVDLRLKILEILEREGKSLVALNALLGADQINTKVIQQKMRLRETLANQIIHRAVVTKAVALALNPVTALDLFSGAVIDVAMILALSRLYQIPMTQRAAVALLQKIGVSMGGVSASEVLANLGLSSLKGLLGLTVPVTAGVTLGPYLAIAVSQASVAGVASYAIGQVTKTYLANGAAWGPEGPKTTVTQILASLDEASVLRRLRGELRMKIRLALTPQTGSPGFPQKVG